MSLLRCVRAFHYRAVDQRALDLLRERRERLADGLHHGDGLAHQRAQLLEDRAVGIGLVVLLLADALDGDQAAGGQPLQLALHGAGAGPGELDQLAGEEAAGRLAEQQRQHALLGGGEKRVGEAGGRVRTAGGRLAASRAGREGWRCISHFGHFNALIGQ